MNRRFFLRSLFGGVAAAGLCRPVRAFAEPEASLREVWESGWSETPQAAMRLIAGGNVKAKDRTVLRAGVEIRLADGFKTYWRDPGDSGVPPVFDWSSSENVEKVELRWPAPRRYLDEAGQTIGYKTSIVFPLIVTPKRRSEPVVLALKLNYAACDKLCIPVQGTARLALPAAGTGPHGASLDRFEAGVPVRRPIGPGAEVAITAAGLIAGDPPKLSLEAVIPKNTRDLAFFAEGPNGFYFGTPSIVSRESGAHGERVIAHLPIEERPKEVTRLPVRLTLVADGRAIECETSLDGLPATR